MGEQQAPKALHLNSGHWLSVSRKLRSARVSDPAVRTTEGLRQVAFGLRPR
jgi:hypothetical protein